MGVIRNLLALAKGNEMPMKKPSHAKPEESFFMLNSHKVFQRMINASRKTSSLHTKLREFYLDINVQ